jgi:hypothetical protein
MQLLFTILTSAVVAALVGPLVTEWLHSRKSKQNARFDALTAAIALEGYAIECATAVINHDLVRQSDGHAGAPMQKVPDIPELPKITVVGEFLRPRKAALASRMLSLPQEAFQAQQHVEFIWDVTGEPSEAAEVLGKESAKVALEAVDLARKLRKQFNLPLRDLRFGKFDVEKALKKNNQFGD